MIAIIHRIHRAWSKGGRHPSFRQRPLRTVERLEDRVLLAAGDLDPTFDGDGRVTANIGDATPLNTPPIADAGGPYIFDEGGTLALDASRSIDPDSDPITIAWDLNGDGQFQDATGAKPVLLPPAPAALGIDDGPRGLLIRVRVADDHGNMVESPPAELQVRNVAPAVFLGTDSEIALGDAFLRAGSFTDPGPDQWTGTVDYGDGAGPIPLSLDGRFIGLEHRYRVPGTFTVSVSISDDDHAAGTYDLQVTVRGPTGSSISGQKFDDLDGSGTHDVGESGLNGWTIELVEAATGIVVATQVTHDVDLNGDGLIDPQTERGLYAFEAVTPGDYVIREVPQAGWRQTVPTGETERVSLTNGGTEADFGSFTPAISGDGRFVSFASDAENLVQGDTNTQTDIFVVDRETGNVDRISVSNTGEQANGSSFDPSISNDGQWIAFRSFASNLVAGDDNDTSDIFVYHRLTRSIRRVTLNIAGRGANDASFDPVISGDGRFVAFDSQASNLVPDDTNGMRDIFIVDLHTRLIERVNVDGAGRQSNEASHQPALSDDGRLVAFASYASNLVPFDTNGEADVFLFNRLTRTIERVSVNDQRTQGNNTSSDPSISGDGRFVAFSSIANNLVAADTNGQADVFVFDRSASRIELVSTNASAESGLGSSVRPSISRDGRFVAFVSYADNLFSLDDNGQPDIFLFDRATAVTELVSLDIEGGTPIHPSLEPAVSADGNTVAFGSFGTNLVADDHNEVEDIFVRSRVGVYRVTVDTDELVGGLDFGNQFRLAAIAGQKVQDTNRNGVRDSSEPGLDGWQVDLLSAATGNIVASQTTFSADLNGDGVIDPVTERGLYQFDAIPPGDYEVREVLESGWRETAPDADQLSFASPTRLDAGAKEFGVTIADFNRDGAMDLAVVNRNSDDVSLLINAGDGTFRPAVRYSIGLAHQPQAIQAADLEGDGDIDLVIASFNVDFASDRASVLLNRGDGTFFPASTVSVGFGSQGLAVADFNGDHLLDIAVANTGSNNIAVLLNRPNIGFPSRGTRYTTQAGPTSVVAGDFDGDGDMDLAVSNHGSNSVSLLRGIGNGFFQMAENSFAGEDVTGLAAGDLDGDGDLDIAVANPNMRTVAILKNRGDGTFNPAEFLTDENNPFYVTAADLDGDGDLDLAASTRSTRSASVFRNNGNATFQPVHHLQAGDDGFSLAAGDLDRDGDLDLVVANGASDDITILRSITHSHMVTVTRGERVEHRDFQNFQLGTIRGRVFIDANSSGTREVSESGLAGWVVFLDSNGNGVVDAGEPSTLSDSLGDYAFRGLPDGSYSVREVRQAGWIGTTPVSRSYSVTISASSPVADRDFGNVLPRISFSTGLFRVDETSSIARITAQLNAAAEMPVTATYATANGTATTRDYQPARGTITFAPGQVQQTFTIPIRNDRRPEGIETVGLELTDANNARLGSLANAQLLIVDGEDLPTVQFQVRSLQLRETVRTATIVVTLSKDMKQQVRVDYKAADLTARDGQDYLARASTLIFDPHETRKTFTIPILDDRIDEPNQEFELTLSNPVGAIVGTSRTVVRILDDDVPPTIGFSPPVVVVNEEDVAAIAYVELNGETEWPVSVTATTEAGGSATSGRDYRASTTTLLFQPGELRKPLIIEIFQDAADAAPEPTETIELRLSSPSNATLGTRFGTIFILDVADATARAQGQMEHAQEAFRSRDSATYRSTLQGLLDESRTLSSNDLLARVEDLTLAASHNGFDGLSPLGATYVHELSLRDDDVSALRRQGAFAALSDSLFLFSDGLSPRNQQDCIEFLESFGSTQDIPSPLGFEEPIGCFNDAPPEEIDSVDLVNRLILDPVYVNGYLLLVMDPHRTIRTGPTGSGWSAEIVGGASELPEGGLIFFSDSNRLVIQGYLANTARTRTFTIRLTNGTLVENFQVTLRVPLALGFQGIPDVDFDEEPGNNFSLPLFASGGPSWCVGIASPAIPCGSMTWNMLPGTNSQLPSWLSLSPQLDANGTPTDNVLLHGTVPDDAFTFSVLVRLQQASATTGVTLTFRIPVSISASDRSAIEGVRRLDRGDAFSLQLPAGHGGDGHNYTWQLGVLSELPDGIQLFERSGHWFVEGTVAETAELGSGRVVLRLHSASGDDAIVPMDFDIGRRFRVLTQNTMLRPDDIITVADFALISAGLASPFTALAATALLIAAGVIEGNYDAEVQNTDDDNIERLNLTADRFSDYDIVALQEVFDQDRREQLGDRAQADFHLFDGPGPSPFIVDFSDVEVHIPQGASGVALLVRHGLSGSEAQTELAQMLPYHHSEIYGSSADSDSHANKGFVFEKVQLGSDPNDFIYVVDTHPQADYAFPGQYESVRAAQLAQIRDYVNAHADPTHPVLFMGDFNIREIDDLNGNGIFDGAAIDAVVPEYLSMLQTLGGNSVADDLARDYWNQHDPTFIAATSDSHRNAYSYYWFDGANNPFRQRLDFVLVRQGTDYRLSANSVGMVDLPINTQQCSNENWINNPPGIQCYVSDHFGLQAELRLERV